MPGGAGVGASEGAFHRRPDKAGVVGGGAAPGAGESVLGQVEALPGVGAPVGEHGQVPPLAVGGHGPDVAEGIVADRGDLPPGGDQGCGFEEGVPPAHIGAPDVSLARGQHAPRLPLGTEGGGPRNRGVAGPGVAQDLVPEGHPETSARRIIRLGTKRGLLDDTAADALADEEPVLAALTAASVRGITATGAGAGQRLRRVLRCGHRGAYRALVLCFVRLLAACGNADRRP